MASNRRDARGAALTIDPAPKFDLSPYLYMQFMEPLGCVDSSVEAGWDFRNHRWREGLIKATQELAPTLIRWPGGLLSSYYRWREAVGPRNKRKPMFNICWDGMESNQVGTHEFIDFCRQVKADPLIAINFESDGRANFMRDPIGQLRRAGPAEAAAWVDYCNNPRNKLRKAHGAAKPFNVKHWQIGNETSYAKHGYDCETTARRTVAFAKAMRKADPDIRLIGWGDTGWAPRMIEVAGEHIDYIAFHRHWGSKIDRAAMQWQTWRDDPAATWEHLMTVHEWVVEKIAEIRSQTDGSGISLAMTEGHYAIGGRNRNELLSTWAAGVGDARVLNAQARNGDVLKIATCADFCGTRWMNNAIMIPRNAFGAYLMPVARVMSLFGRHKGRKAVEVTRSPSALDITASRTGKKVYLHVVNTNRTRSVAVKLGVDGLKIVSGKVWQISADPMLEIMEVNADAIAPVARKLPRGGAWRFPAASVSAVELTTEPLAKPRR